jgi:hypothetical protein
VVNHRKPRVQTPIVSRYPAPAPIHDFILLFLPPCSPHLTPLATGSLKPSLLVSPLLGGPARHRPFALTCTNANQVATCTCNTQPRVTTLRCQSLITARSNHQLVLGRSGPDAPSWSRQPCPNRREPNLVAPCQERHQAVAFLQQR